MSAPSNNPVVQQLQLLLGGYGFNFYSDINKARADDLLVRQAASNHLTGAASKLTALESAYKTQFIPPSTRENPYPPAGVMQSMREITALKQRVSDAETRLRSMPVPTQDKIWWRFRNELILLDQLLSCDSLLIEISTKIEQEAVLLTARAWDDPAIGARTSLDSSLAELDSAMKSRMQLLQMG